MKAATGSLALPAGFQNQNRPVPRHRGTATYREAPPTATVSRWHEKPGIAAAKRPSVRSHAQRRNEIKRGPGSQSSSNVRS